MKHNRFRPVWSSALLVLSLGVASMALAQAPLPCGQVEAQAAFDAAHPEEAETRAAREADVRAAARDVACAL